MVPTERLVVVTGLPRSGTSLLMQMLAAGGMPVLADGVRTADESNPRGYLEYEPVKRLAADSRWLSDAGGRAVKIILQLMPHVPAGTPMDVLCLDRPVADVVASQSAMLRRMGKAPAGDPAQLEAVFSRQRAAVLAELQRRPGVRLLEVSHQRLLARDAGEVARICGFLGRTDLDAGAMLSAIDPALHRTGNSSTGDRDPAHRRRLPWASGQVDGLVVVSVPKSGTNFLSRYLSRITGWPHRWGRPSRDSIDLLGELPAAPDPEVAGRAVHLIQTPTDIAALPPDQRPALFGNRRLVSLEDEPAAPAETGQPLAPGAAPSSPGRRIIAEHPVRSLPWFLRNPSTVPLLSPREVMEEAASLRYGVVFLYRDLRDVANSLSHFLHAGTRYVHFPSLEVSQQVVVEHYLPVLAAAIRLWKQEFPGRIVTYEDLVHRTRPTLESLISEFDLPASPGELVSTTDQFPTFTLRKGGTGDWRNHLPHQLARQILDRFPDLVTDPDA